MRPMKFIFLLITIFVSLTLSGQEKLFRLNLEGKSYEKLIMSSSSGLKMYIEGESENGSNWIFRIPDDHYETVINFQICPQDYDYEKREEYIFSFITKEGNDTLKTIYNNFACDNMVLNARFVKTVKSEVPTRNPYTMIADVFEVIFEGNTDLKLRQKYPYFSFFQEYPKTEKRYEDFLEEYFLICQSHPDSRYLLTNIFSTKDYYNDKKELKKLYDCFISELQESYYGRKLHQYLTYYEFENTELLHSDNVNHGYIVENPDKYTLLIFSASWCLPCHKLLPTLKTLYTDLSDYMDMVYISRDESNTITGWQDFLEKEEIPWRSYLSYNRKDFCDKYDVQAIPHGLLVHPDGKAEVINPANEKDVKKMYNLFKCLQVD